jgi:flagellar hook-basal body complex protein FliE
MTGFDLPRLDTGLRPIGLPTGDAPRPDGPDGSDGPDRGDGFGGVLADAIERVDGLQRDVRDKTRALAAGEPVALHDVMLSMGKSEVAFNLMLEVRNKLVEAWEKLSRSVV